MGEARIIMDGITIMLEPANCKKRFQSAAETIGTKIKCPLREQESQWLFGSVYSVVPSKGVKQIILDFSMYQVVVISDAALLISQIQYGINETDLALCLIFSI